MVVSSHQLPCLEPGSNRGPGSHHPGGAGYAGPKKGRGMRFHVNGRSFDIYANGNLVWYQEVGERQWYLGTMADAIRYARNSIVLVAR